MAIDDIDRRSLLRLGGVAAVSSLAGCGGQSSGALTEPTETRLSPREAGATSRRVRTSSGGPDNRQSSATVGATMLDSEQGAGQNVFPRPSSGSSRARRSAGR